MLAQIPRALGSTALVATLLVWAMAFEAPTVTRADDCLTAPNSAAPAGSHWYYHMDSAKQRKCWYVRVADQSAQHATAQPASDPANAVAEPASDPANAAAQPASNPPGPPHTTSIPSPRPAAGSVSAPMSITPGDSAPPLPRIKMLTVKPQRAVSGVTTSRPLKQSAAQPQASSTSSIPETPGPRHPRRKQNLRKRAAKKSLPRLPLLQCGLIRQLLRLRRKSPLQFRPMPKRKLLKPKPTPRRRPNVQAALARTIPQ